ncbi:beta-eliminating lyase-related protein [Mangrovicoccus ximenensis]|uniref:beta-eliminating lyase-related protein n=1 Tax=Mangrovicoccus ximenensis TaxID=1911570 RepID=UPI00191C075B|nr:beta-eliminating lyase-related protein [Mangrovicoccus ximenensis]
MQFASDNAGPVHPKVMEALVRANDGYAPGYGADEVTARAVSALRGAFEAPEAEVFLAGTGTAANALILAAMAQPWETVFCARTAHIEEDECGAPEFFSAGAKLTLLDGPDGKIAPEALEAALAEAAPGAALQAALAGRRRRRGPRARHPGPAGRAPWRDALAGNAGMRPGASGPPRPALLAPRRTCGTGRLSPASMTHGTGRKTPQTAIGRSLAKRRSGNGGDRTGDGALPARTPQITALAGLFPGRPGARGGAKSRSGAGSRQCSEQRCVQDGRTVSGTSRRTHRAGCARPRNGWRRLEGHRPNRKPSGNRRKRAVPAYRRAPPMQLPPDARRRPSPLHADRRRGRKRRLARTAVRVPQPRGDPEKIAAAGPDGRRHGPAAEHARSQGGRAPSLCRDRRTRPHSCTPPATPA